MQPLTPPRLHVAKVLRTERDELHLELVKECETLLDHDARVRAAQKELGRVINSRDAAKLRLDAMRDKIDGVEAAFRELTGYDMPGYSPLK